MKSSFIIRIIKLQFSIIIPVYNRPKEIDDLLTSFLQQNFKEDYEILIIEDGSTKKSDVILKKYTSKLNIKYFYKENSGAGASRNFGMQKATGNYFIILDSDVVLPSHYLTQVNKALQNKYTDAFGGPDTAHKSFTPMQKAINYAMTSFLTTGGIRGKKKGVGKFQLRSFNLGISKKAFLVTQGFSNMKTGEDIDLTFRLWKQGFQTQLITLAFVYHKRRSTLQQFFKQTCSFGIARPILNRKYPESKKITFWFPTLFMLGLLGSLLFKVFGFQYFLYVYYFYFIVLFVDATIQNKSIKIALYSLVTTFIQFLGYGSGFFKSQFLRK